MAIVRKQTLYQLLTIAWWIAVAAVIILVGSGTAEPYASPAAIPYGPSGAFGGIILFGLVGTALFRRLETRSWKRTGRAAGLGPTGDGFLGKPDLAGTVGGRRVTASTYSVKQSSGGENGSSSATYTLVEADVRDPTTDGYIVGTGSVSTYDDDIPEQTRTRTVDGDYYVIGDVSADDAQAVVSRRLRDAFTGASGVDAVVVGDPTQAVMGSLPDDLDGFLGSMLVSGLESALEEKESFAAGTAAHDSEGLLLDPAELEARATAVAAAADAHEHADLDAAPPRRSAE